MLTSILSPVLATPALISLAPLLPLLAVAAIVAARRHPDLREACSLAAALALFVVCCLLYARLEQGEVLEAHWFELLPGLAVAFHVERLGMLFSLIASALWFVTILYAIGYMRAHQEANQTRFYACFAIAIGAVMGVAFAQNLFTLFIFYEALTLCTYPLVAHAGTDKARRGARVYLAILLSTSIAFFLPAILITWHLAGTLDFSVGGVLPDETPLGLLSLMLLLFAFGIGKAALMPFHRWLPAAMVAPTPVSALLHAVAVVKAGVFTLLKVGLYIFGPEMLGSIPATQWLLYLAGASILLASLVAMRQDNLKARLAYSTVSQLGYVTLGALLAVGAGIGGAAMHIAMHAFGKITLFFCAGAILVASHESEISRMRGLGRQMPWTMVAFFIASLSIIGLPPTGGTWSKWYLMLGSLHADQLALMAVLMLSSLLNIAYLLPIPLRGFLSAPVSGHEGHREAPLACLLAIGVTSLMCLLLFFRPQPLYELIAPLMALGVER